MQARGFTSTTHHGGMCWRFVRSMSDHDVYWQNEATASGLIVKTYW